MRYSIIKTAILLAALNVYAVHINQIGYYPFAKKTATVADSSKATFCIIDAASNEAVYTSTVTPAGFDKSAGEYVSVADFTLFNKRGTYRLVYDNKDTSTQFSISDSIYTGALYTVLKSYYYLRCGVLLPGEFAGKWEREAGHLADSSLTVYDFSVDSTYDVRGGWYDAGDYGKYVVCAGITCGTLLELFELYPELIDDSSLKIPESGNEKSDLLDEVQYELDWLIRMQDSDGGVFFKVGPIKWYDFIMPANDKSKRYIIGKSTTSALNFSAVMAMAGRLYKNYDSTFAHDCIIRSKNALNWAKANPAVAYPENVGGTGPYEDGTNKTYSSDELLWALSELAITTREPAFIDTVEKLILTKAIAGPPWWQDVKNLAFYSLAVNDVLSDSASSYVKNQIITYADKMVTAIRKSPYQNPLTTKNYSWGSNGVDGNIGVIMAYAHYLTQDQKYLDGLVWTADYVFGRNPMGCSYITGLGARPPLYPHHRQSGADDIEEPVPGLVVGGPNSDPNGADEDLVEVIEMETAPAKCYVDVQGSWASNENSINQNAPWVFVLGYLEKNASANHATPVKKNRLQSTTVKRGTIKTSSEKGGIRILCDEAMSVESVKLFNLQGKCIMKRDVSAGEHLVFLEDVGAGSGSLIVELRGRNGVEHRKVHLVK